MTILNSEFVKLPHHYYQTKLGDVYFFENFFVAEFKEGLDINFSNFSEVHQLIKNHYKDKPFAFISNRIHSYSIVLGDAKLFNERYPNCFAYAIVAYKQLTEKVIEIENKFFKFNRQSFTTLPEAIQWVDNYLYLDS